MIEKRPKYERLDPTADVLVYDLLAKVRREHHRSTEDAAIALVWVNDVKPDVDGHLMLGRCKKVSPLEQEFHNHDFIIQLNRDAWNVAPPEHREAVLDHELCHVGRKVDDDTGEESWYVVRHDLEEFEAVVRRRGLWRSEVERFVKAATDREQQELFEKDKASRKKAAASS